jgi:hypothetical protein
VLICSGCPQLASNSTISSIYQRRTTTHIRTIVLVSSILPRANRDVKRRLNIFAAYSCELRYLMSFDNTLHRF